MKKTLFSNKRCKKIVSIMLALILSINSAVFSNAGNYSKQAHFDYKSHWAKNYLNDLSQKSTVFKNISKSWENTEAKINYNSFLKLLSSSQLSEKELSKIAKANKISKSKDEKNIKEEIDFAALKTIFAPKTKQFKSLEKNKHLTRIQAIDILFHGLKLDNKTTKNLFDDVKKDIEGYSSLEYAKANGFAKGYKNKFRPFDYITVAEASALISRLCNYANEDTLVKLLEKTNLSSKNNYLAVGRKNILKINNFSKISNLIKLSRKSFKFKVSLIDGKRVLNTIYPLDKLDFFISSIPDNDIRALLRLDFNDKEIFSKDLEFISKNRVVNPYLYTESDDETKDESTDEDNTNKENNTHEIVVAQDKTLSLNMDKFLYSKADDTFLTSSRVKSITGKVAGFNKPVVLGYMIKDENNFVLSKGDINTKEEFTLNKIALGYGKNTLEIKVKNQNKNEDLSTNSSIASTTNSHTVINVTTNSKTLIKNTTDSSTQINKSSPTNLIVTTASALKINILNFNDENIENALALKIDSDGDGLSDYIEFYITETDPYKKDTDGNGINDGDEDFDNDGLSNLEELRLGTSLVEADTDGDSISDGDEVNKYKTNPLSRDTDNDGLSDDLEIKYGTDPNNPDTNGNGILDGDEKYEIEKKSENYNKNNDVNASVKLNVKGNKLSSLKIKEVSKKDIFLNDQIPGFISEGYDLTVDDTFDNAELTFKISDKVKNTKDMEPAIYYYDEKAQFLTLVKDQVYDKDTNTIKANLKHFSKYILLNKKVFEAVWNKEIKPPNTANEVKKDLHVVLSIDCSGSMDWNDPNMLRKDAAEEFIDKIKETDKVGIVTFTNYYNIIQDLNSNKKLAKESLSNIYSSGGTSISSAVKGALELLKDSKKEHKYIILMTDGDGTYDESYTKKAQDLEIAIYTIGLGDEVNESLLKKISKETGGKYFHASKDKDLKDIYIKTAEETVDYHKDSDQDGISDYYEELSQKSILRASNGTIVKLDPNDPDTDGDGLLDGEEVEIKEKDGKVYLYMHSNPNLKDSDFDGIPDKIDDEPLSNIVKFKWGQGNGKKPAEISFPFDYRKLFDKDKKFDANIGKMSLIYSKLAYGDDIQAVTSGRESEYSNYSIPQVFGATIEEREYLGRYLNYEEVLFTRSKFKLQDGSKKNIIQVAIRGTDGIKDISANISNASFLASWLNSDKKTASLTHQGFTDVAQTLSREIYSKIVKYGYKNNTLVWITGHSRGAAIANLTADILNRMNINAIAYTFASPNTIENGASYFKDGAHHFRQDLSSVKIYNIINKRDPITKHPWLYHRLGIDKIYDPQVYKFPKNRLKCIGGDPHRTLDVFPARDVDKTFANHDLETYYMILKNHNLRNQNFRKKCRFILSHSNKNKRNISRMLAEKRIKCRKEIEKKYPGRARKDHYGKCRTPRK